MTRKNPSSGDKKLEFKYDYLGRRVAKLVYDYTTQWPATPDEEFYYVYDTNSWNPIIVQDENGMILAKYTWGLDLSGLNGDPSVSGIEGAGGIGGLLAMVDTKGTWTTSDDDAYWFIHDGQGNVVQMVENATGYNVAARYEYGPYGNVIGPDEDADGDWEEHATPVALNNPFRYQSKWFDEETGLGNWGKRYYSPRLGRWMNRDPIGEAGGLNLYAYVGNDPVNVMDLLGQNPGGTPRCSVCCNSSKSAIARGKGCCFNADTSPVPVKIRLEDAGTGATYSIVGPGLSKNCDGFISYTIFGTKHLICPSNASVDPVITGGIYKVPNGEAKEITIFAFGNELFNITGHAISTIAIDPLCLIAGRGTSGCVNNWAR